MCCYDCTVFPSNATYVKQSGLALSNLLALTSSSFCHCQMPLLQSQTSIGAVVKHRRLLEDQFMRGNLNIIWQVQQLYSKPDGGGRDNRALSQPCLALVHNNFDNPEWLKSEAIIKGNIGPAPLIRFNDLLGFDETTRPSAQSRVEQILAFQFLSDFALNVWPTRPKMKFVFLAKYHHP